MDAKLEFQEMENPAPGTRGAFGNDLLGGSVNSENSQSHALTQDRLEYLLAEFRSAALRLRAQLNEVDAMGLALKAGLISGDLAIERLDDCGVPLFIWGAPPTGGVQ
jgi:hypothetical protein